MGLHRFPYLGSGGQWGSLGNPTPGLGGLQWFLILPHVGSGGQWGSPGAPTLGLGAL